MKNLGEMRHKIAIYKQSFVEDEVLGTDEPADVLLCKIWADIAPRTGSLLMGRDANTMLSKTTHAITVRSRGDITPDCYILHKDEFGNEHKFTIDYIKPPLKNLFMTIYAREEV